MAQLLLSWLNDDVKLTKYVQSLEGDFCDGYLLGELLFKYNQIRDFQKFISKDTPDAKINNFCLLEPAMRQVGVNFNSKIAFDVMHAKPEAMRTLLYELRVSLERIRKISQMASTANKIGNTGGLTIPSITSTIRPNAEKVYQVIRPSKPLFDKSMAATFENAIRSMMENPNDVLMERIVGHYKERKTEFRATVQLAHSHDVETMETEFRRRRELDRQRKAHEREFSKAWDQLNIEQWKRNQRIAHERRTLTKKVVGDITVRTEIRRTNYEVAVRDGTLEKIDEFDRRMELEVHQEDENLKATLGKTLRKIVAGDASRGVPELTYINNAYLRDGLVLAQKTMKEKHEDSNERQSLHSRRRRKFVREREALHTSSLQKVAASEIVDQLLNPCQSEMFEDQYMSRVMTYRAVISENRLNRNQLMEQLNYDEAQRRQEWSSEVAVREFEWVVAHRMASQAERFGILEEATMAANRQDVTEICEEIVHRLLDMTEWVISCRALGLYDVLPEALPQSSSTATAEDSTEASSFSSGGESFIPEPFWSDAKEMFTSELPIPEALRLPVPTNVYDYFPAVLSERPEQVDAEWLLHGPFKAHRAMTVVVLSLGDDLSLSSLEEGGYAATGTGTESNSSDRGVNVLAIVDQDTATGLSHPTEISAAGEHEIVLTANHSVDSALIDGSSAAPSRPLTSVAANETDPLRAIALQLADNDKTLFIETIASVEIPGYDAVPSLREASSRPTTPADPAKMSAAAAASKIASQIATPVESLYVDAAKLVTTPQWIFDTPSKYLLGELVIYVRSVAEEYKKVVESEGARLAAEQAMAQQQSGGVPGAVGANAEGGEGGGLEIALPATEGDGELSLAFPPSPSVAAIASRSGTAGKGSVPSSPKATSNPKSLASRGQTSKSTSSEAPAKEMSTVPDAPPSELPTDVVPASEVPPPVNDIIAFEPAAVPPPSLAVRVALSGLSNLARKTVAEAIQSRSQGSVKIIRAEELVLQALALAQGLVASGAEPQDDTERIAQQVLFSLESGDVLSDDVYVALVANAVREVEEAAKVAVRVITSEFVEESNIAEDLEPITGFVIEDFPNTKSQAVLFLEALSGINYDSHKAQRTDFKTEFAPPKPFIEERHDGRLCGLDAVLFITSSGVLDTTGERVTVRRDAFTGEILYLNGEQTSMDGIEEIVDPVRPVHTAAVEIALSSREVEDLKYFLTGVGILQSLEVVEYGSLAEAAAAAAALIFPAPEVVMEGSPEDQIIGDSYAFVDDVAHGIERLAIGSAEEAISALEPLLDAAPQSGANSPVKSAGSNEQHIRVSVSFGGVEEGDVSSANAAAAASGALIFSQSRGIHESKVCELPGRLATSLEQLWDAAEVQSRSGAKLFFAYLRDARYEIVQRRRALHDGVKSLLVRRDNRQRLFDNFVLNYNAVEEDFRFDPHCAAEFHLRALELREEMLTVCLTRQKEADDFVKKSERDGVAKFLVHMCECEAAALLQVELNRFIAALHLIFDYTKAVTGYDTSRKVLNALEETLELVVPTTEAGGSTSHDADAAKSVAAAKAKDHAKAAVPVKDAAKGAAAGKDAKGKKGGDKSGGAPVPLVPYREAIAPIVLPFEVMSAGTDVEPEPSSSAEAEGAATAASAAAKKGGKAVAASAPAAKKGAAAAVPAAAATASSPLQIVEKVLADTIAAWDKHAYTVQRQLYDENEQLCQLIETAVWHEAERLRYSTSVVHKAMDGQSKWLKDMETSILSALTEIIRKRYTCEASVVERLSVMIGESIENAEPIREQWLLAPDAIAVMKESIIVPTPEPPPIPEVVDFYTDRLNEEQADILHQWLEQVSVGMAILEQDLDALLDRALSGAGPVGCVVSSGDGILSHVMLPQRWRASHVDSPRIESQLSEHAGEAEAEETEFGVQTGLTDDIIIIAPAAATADDDDFLSSSESVLALERASAAAAATRAEPIMEVARKALLPRQKVSGIDEYVGVVSLQETVDKIMQPSSFIR